MFHPRRHRLLSCLLLAAYLAASTVGGLFHSHGDSEHGHGHACHHLASHDHHAHHDCDGSHDAADHDAVGLTQPHDETPLHNDDCTVCRFVGQPTVAAEVAPLILLCDLGVELVVVHALGPAASLARTLHSRAPPSVG